MNPIHPMQKTTATKKAIANANSARWIGLITLLAAWPSLIIQALGLVTRLGFRIKTAGAPDQVIVPFLESDWLLLIAVVMLGYIIRQANRRIDQANEVLDK